MSVRVGLMRALYHFEMSLFSRRARLGLALKGLDCELRDAREHAQFHDEARERFPLATLPVLVDGDEVVGDSMAILRFLDVAYAEGPRLWPTERAQAARALAVVTLVDGAMSTLVDLGTRYHTLRDHPSFQSLAEERIGRARQALADVGERAGSASLTGAGFGAAEAVVFAAVEWLRGVPARVPSAPHLAPIVELGLVMPAPLLRWADGHRAMPEIVAIYGR